MRKGNITAEHLFRNSAKRCMLLSDRCGMDIDCTHASDRCTTCVFPIIMKDDVFQTIGLLREQA